MGSGVGGGSRRGDRVGTNESVVLAQGPDDVGGIVREMRLSATSAKSDGTAKMVKGSLRRGRVLGRLGATGGRMFVRRVP